MAQERVLITGMSGTGKSTIARELRSLGHRAVDLDDGWRVTTADGEWIWDEQLVDDLLSADHAQVEPLLRAAATHEVDVDRPLAAVVHDVLAIIDAA